MSRIEDMLRDPGNRPSTEACDALAARVLASIEGEPDPPRASRRPLLAAAGAVAVVAGISALAMWPGGTQGPDRAIGEDPRRTVVEMARDLAEREVGASVEREAMLLMGDAQAVLEPFRLKLSRL